jgi:predicted ATP-grasp superfamily ATP-dependent carboligase
MPDKRCAVVLSSDAIGLGATRSLGAGGVRTIVVMQHRWEPVRFSRYGEKRVVPRSGDFEDALMAVLRGITMRHRPVLIPTSDFYADFIDRHRTTLQDRFRCSIPSRDVMALVLDKARDTKRLAAAGISLPRTVADLPPRPDDLVRALGLPLIIKPRTYVDKRELGWRNVVARRPEHVVEFYGSHRHALGRVIAQELIPGADTALWECIGVFDDRHELRTAFTFRKLRTVPAHFGQTSHGRSERNEEVLAVARRIGALLEYTGPADFDLKYDERDGRYKYLELNPRLGLCNYFAMRCGVNLALAAYHAACGDEMPATSQRDGRTFLALMEDCGGRLQDGDSIPRVCRDLVTALVRRPIGSYAAWEDLLPGPLAAVRLGLRLIDRAIRGQLASVFTKEFAISREALVDSGP